MHPCNDAVAAVIYRMGCCRFCGQMGRKYVCDDRYGVGHHACLYHSRWLAPAYLAIRETLAEGSGVGVLYGLVCRVV